MEQQTPVVREKGNNLLYHNKTRLYIRLCLLLLSSCRVNDQVESVRKALGSNTLLRVDTLFLNVVQIRFCLSIPPLLGSLWTLLFLFAGYVSLHQRKVFLFLLQYYEFTLLFEYLLSTTVIVPTMDDLEVAPTFPPQPTLVKELQNLLFYDIIPFMLAAAIACIGVVTITMVSEHATRSLFPLLGLIAVVFHSLASYLYTSQTTPKYNPYGGFLVVVWFWLLWGSTGCVDRGGFQLNSQNNIFHGLAESDIALLFIGLCSELFLLTGLETSIQTVFPLAISAFFSVVPFVSEDTELLRIQVFLVFATRYFMVYQVRRSIHGKENTLAIDYTVALSGFWILTSKNFLVIMLGVALGLCCQLFSITFVEDSERKKK